MSSIKFRSVGVVAAAAAAFALAVAPARATGVDDESGSLTVRAADSGVAAPRFDGGPHQRICVRGYYSGSLVRHTICQSRSHWDRDGGVPA